MKKIVVAALAVFCVSGVASAMPESVVAYHTVGTSLPLLTGTFGANVKKGTAWITVGIISDNPDYGMPSTGDDASSEDINQYSAVTSPLALTLAANGDIVYTSVDGDSVVCAKVLTKKFLGFKYHKVKATGACTFVTAVESLGNGQSNADLEMDIKK